MSGRGVLGLAVAAALVAGGCGTASSSTTSTSTSRPASTPKTTATRTVTSATVVPPGSVAVAAGTPITQGAFNHWMNVVARSQSASSPGQPTIVPTDPPSFTACVAQVRKQIPALRTRPAKTLRADCAQLYRSMSSQVMDFLIKADWIQADGTRLGLLPSEAEVDRTLNADKSTQFPNGAGYQAFLAKTGQTAQDVRYRVKINVTFSRLTARQKGSTAAKQTAVSNREKRLYGALTRCAAVVLMADCANYRAG